MSEKKTGKRLLSWVLVLIMALSMLPLNVLAGEVGGDSVIYGHYEGNNWTSGPDPNAPSLPVGVDSVSKTAERVGQPEDNTYAVTLQVVLKETTTNVPSQAATVLVIDTSNSMACPKKEHTHSDECYAGKWVDCTPEDHPDHWYFEEGYLLGRWVHKENVGCKDYGHILSHWKYYLKDEPEVLTRPTPSRSTPRRFRESKTVTTTPSTVPRP